MSPNDATASRIAVNGQVPVEGSAITEVARARLPWVVWAVAMVLLAGVLTLVILNDTLAEDTYFALVGIAIILGYSTVGSVLASRNPRSSIGWLMLVVGLAFALVGFGDEYVRYAYVTNPGSLPGRAVVAVITNTLWIVMFSAVILLVLLFPTGEVPSRRWRHLPKAIFGLAGLALLAGLLYPGALELDIPAAVVNPFGVEALEPLLNAVATLAWIGLIGVAGPLSIVAIELRYRRSRGEERQQLRWLAYIATTTVVVVVAGIVTANIMGESFGTSLATDVFALVGFGLVGIGVPIAMGIAVLRYRLYDLDLVVKKTVIFGIVVGGITLLLLAVVVLLPTAVVGTGLTTWERGLFLVGVTIGLVFGPLRRRARRIADRIVYGSRATPYEVLTAFSERVGETYATQDVLPRMTSVLVSGTGATMARVLLRVGPEVREVARWPANAEPSSAEHVVPVVDQGEELGALALSMPANDPMNPAKERLVRDLASQAGLVLRNVRLIEELRASRVRLVAAQDEERRKIERDIHDGAQQQLVALTVRLRLAEGLVRKDPAKTEDLLGDLGRDAQAALEDLRDLSRGIYPPLLADHGLASALEAQARKAPLPVLVEVEGIGRYPRALESAVYFCTLEALNNVAKYSQASAAVVRLAQSDGILAFEVVDDGRGFDPDTVGRGTGLQGMADRIDAVGGELRVDSRPSRGTSVVGRIPVDGDA